MTIAVDRPRVSGTARTSAAHLASAQLSPAGRGRTVDDILLRARSGLSRLYPHEVLAAVAAGAIVVDIRPQDQRIREGVLPGALAIERNVLEWRVDPTGPDRLATATDHDVVWIVVCSEGHSSSLAAAALHELGLWRATDVVGGYRAMVSAGVASVSEQAAHSRRETASLATL